MNHFDARQDKVTRRWHYTCRSGLEIWAVGRCDLDGGHETEEGARACYRGYLLENARTNVKLSDAVPCLHEGCDKKTERAATVADRTFPLCKDHMAAKFLDALFPQVGTIVSS